MREGVLVLLQPQLSLDRKVVRPFAGREEDFEDVREQKADASDPDPKKPWWKFW